MFNKLFSQLGNDLADEQKQRIMELNRLLGEMNSSELKFIFTKELFDAMDKMIEEKKLDLENAIMLLKHMGNYKELKKIGMSYLAKSLLNERLAKMIIDEETKKEEKNEQFLIDLCECYLMPYDGFTSIQPLAICMSCLLKVALNKKENEEVQKEVEMAFLALSCIDEDHKILQKAYLKEMIEIMKYHQEHHNLTLLACQSAWQFLIQRLFFDNGLEGMLTNELHFAREAARELIELIKCVDWKREIGGKTGKEEEEVFIIWRWLLSLEPYFLSFHLWNEEFSGLINSIVQVFRAAKDKFRNISKWCIILFSLVVINRAVEVEDFLKSGAVDTVLEEIQQPTLDDEMLYECFKFFMKVLRRLKEKNKDEKDEVKRKEIKMEVFEKMEEEGYEDVIASFYKMFDLLNGINCRCLSLNVSDCLVNV